VDGWQLEKNTREKLQDPKSKTQENSKLQAENMVGKGLTWLDGKWWILSLGYLFTKICAIFWCVDEAWRESLGNFKIRVKGRTLAGSSPVAWWRAEGGQAKYPRWPARGRATGHGLLLRQRQPAGMRPG